MNETKLFFLLSVLCMCYSTAVHIIWKRVWYAIFFGKFFLGMHGVTTTSHTTYTRRLCVRTIRSLTSHSIPLLQIVEAKDSLQDRSVHAASQNSTRPHKSSASSLTHTMLACIYEVRRALTFTLDFFFSPILLIIIHPWIYIHVLEACLPVLSCSTAYAQVCILHVHTDVCVCAYIYIYIYIYIYEQYICMYIHTHKDTNTHTHTHTHMSMHIVTNTKFQNIIIFFDVSLCIRTGRIQ